MSALEVGRARDCKTMCPEKVPILLLPIRSNLDLDPKLAHVQDLPVYPSDRPDKRRSNSEEVHDLALALSVPDLNDPARNQDLDLTLDLALDLDPNPS